MIERILKYPGFIYQIGQRYYYLGKWICKECTDTQATDSVFMYRMSRAEGEERETNLYFQKIRAYADFALEIPYNPAQIKENLNSLSSALTDDEAQALEQQLHYFEEDYPKYCGKELA